MTHVRVRAAVALALLAGSASLFAVVPAGAQSALPPPGTASNVRPEVGSNRNLRSVSRHLEGLIDQLQRDQRDYGGHRVAAIAALEQARTEIGNALAYDRAHPGQ